MLVSEYILCQKAFDAAESEHYEKLSNVYNAEKEIQKFGSNDWESSNIREWLNSSDQTVIFSTHPPTKESVSNNSYYEEPGFLSNFSQSEREKIQPINHDACIDKVYLLSTDEINKYIQQVNFSRIRQITSTGKTHGGYKDFIGNNWSYWSRTSIHGSISCVDGVFNADSGADPSNALSCNANNGVVGVLPALNLKSDISTSGSGTKDNPWKVM